MSPASPRQPDAPGNLQEEIGKKTPFEEPEQEAYLNLLRTHAELHGQFDRLFREHGLSDPQYNALRIVAAAGTGGIHSETIGERMVARMPDTTRLIDRLERAGLVQRTRRADDRRCVLVTITTEGRRRLRAVGKSVTALHRAQLGHLTRH
ncbi:MAG: MarR family transcriptional regulator, partial [Phycisphaerales bacterium]|nr:MarR family transcriptional regulator [Phycisphaerales bacterium]